MRQLWTAIEIDAPAQVVWNLLVDLDAWPRWGPSVRAATVDGGVLAAGARGSVQTAVGLTVPFEITRFEPGHRWAWRVGGVEATDHRVDGLDDASCRLAFGVPWPAAAYLAVCRVALGRIERLATADAPPG